MGPSKRHIFNLCDRDTGICSDGPCCGDLLRVMVLCTIYQMATDFTITQKINLQPHNHRLIKNKTAKWNAMGTLHAAKLKIKIWRVKERTKGNN